MVSLYLFTNNFVLMSNFWKYYLYYICVAKKPINMRRVLDLLSFQVSLLNWAAHCHFQWEFHCRSKADRICVLDIPQFQGYQLWRTNSTCKGNEYSAKCPVFIEGKYQYLLEFILFLFLKAKLTSINFVLSHLLQCLKNGQGKHPFQF